MGGSLNFRSVSSNRTSWSGFIAHVQPAADRGTHHWRPRSSQSRQASSPRPAVKMRCRDDPAARGCVSANPGCRSGAVRLPHSRFDPFTGILLMKQHADKLTRTVVIPLARNRQHLESNQISTRHFIVEDEPRLALLRCLALCGPDRFRCADLA
jgi:hypothetical protein